MRGSETAGPVCIDTCIYTVHTRHMSSYRTFINTTFRTQRDFLAAVEAGTIQVGRVTPFNEKLFNASFTCATDTYPDVPNIMLINKTTARRLGVDA